MPNYEIIHCVRCGQDVAVTIPDDAPPDDLYFRSRAKLGPICPNCINEREPYDDLGGA